MENCLTNDNLSHAERVNVEDRDQGAVEGSEEKVLKVLVSIRAENALGAQCDAALPDPANLAILFGTC